MTALVSPEAASCLDSICRQAFLMLAGMEAGPAHTPSAPAYAVACRISIQEAEGAQSDLLIRADASFAKHFAQNLFGKPAEDVDEEEIADALRELANTVGGNLKGVLEAETSLSIPEMVPDVHSCRADVVTRSGYLFADAGECSAELCGA